MGKIQLVKKAQMPPDAAEQFVGEGPMGNPSPTEDFDLARITMLSSIEPLLDYIENDISQGIRPAPGDEQIHQALLEAQSMINQASTKQDLDMILSNLTNKIRSVGTASNYQGQILQSIQNLGLNMAPAITPTSPAMASALKIAIRMIAQVNPRFELNYPEYDKNIGPTGWEDQRFDNPYVQDDRTMYKNVNPDQQMNPQQKEQMQQVVDLLAQAVNVINNMDHPSRKLLERLLTDASKAFMNARRLLFQLNDPNSGGN